MSEQENRVVLTDIDISFGRLIVLFVKFGLAAIPAAIIVWLIMAVLIGLFGALFGGVDFMGGMMGGRY